MFVLMQGTLADAGPPDGASHVLHDPPLADSTDARHSSDNDGQNERPGDAVPSTPGQPHDFDSTVLAILSPFECPYPAAGPDFPVLRARMSWGHHHVRVSAAADGDSRRIPSSTDTEPRPASRQDFDSSPGITRERLMRDLLGQNLSSVF
jgi:hypothetical protein